MSRFGLGCGNVIAMIVKFYLVYLIADGSLLLLRHASLTLDIKGSGINESDP